MTSHHQMETILHKLLTNLTLATMMVIITAKF